MTMVLTSSGRRWTETYRKVDYLSPGLGRLKASGAARLLAHNHVNVAVDARRPMMGNLSHKIPAEEHLVPDPDKNRRHSCHVLLL